MPTTVAPLIREPAAAEMLVRVALAPDEARLMQMLRALSNPVRLQMIGWLAEHPNCITGEIVQVAGLAQSTVSQHLGVLREAGLVCGTITGPATCYCVNGEALEWFAGQVGTWVGSVQATCAACSCDDGGTSGSGRCDC